MSGGGGIGRTVVDEGLKTKLQPLLSDAGFGLFRGGAARRVVGERVDVLGIESFSRNKLLEWGLPANSFSLEAGCFFSFLQPLFGREVVQEKITPQMCHVRVTPGRQVWQWRARHSPNVWAVDDEGKNLERCLDDAADVIKKSVLPWFSRFGDLNSLERVLLEEPEEMRRWWGFGAKGSPVRSLLTGLVAARLGHAEIARVHLRRALESPGLNDLAGSDAPLRAASEALKQLS